jgi:cytochrome P450
LFGRLGEFRRDQRGYVRELWRTYGDYFRIPTIPGYPIYALADPAAVEYVLAKNYQNYPKPEFLLKPIRQLLGNGLFTSQGEFWLRQRRLAQPAFLRTSLIQHAGPMTSVVEGLTQSWEAAPDGRMVDMASEMMRLVLKMASSTLFGIDLSNNADAIGTARVDVWALVRYKAETPLSAPLWVPTRRNRAYRAGKRLLDEVVLGVIASRRASGSFGNDVLGRLLAARDEESGTGMSDKQLLDECLLLLFAGQDTTGTGLAWAWYLLARHPEVQEALHDEAAAHLGGRTPTAEDLPHLPLATAIFEEAIRLYTTTPGLVRESVAADEIQGHPVPAKAIIMPSVWLIHRHPAHWDAPEKFRPERFLPGQGTERPKFAYFPFGGGPTVCIGSTFALFEATMALSGLAQGFQFQLADGREIVPDTTITGQPRGGVPLIVRKRSK